MLPLHVIAVRYLLALLQGRMPVHASTYCHFYPEARVIPFISGNRTEGKGFVLHTIRFCNFGGKKSLLGFGKRNATAGRFPACRKMPHSKDLVIGSFPAQVSLRLLFLSFL